MSDDRSVSVIGRGIFCPAGLAALTSAAAIRAGICRYRDVDLGDGAEPWTMALVADEHLPALSTNHDHDERSARLLRLAKRGGQEALAGHHGGPVPLLLALPEPYAGGREWPCTDILTRLQLELGGALDLGRSRVFPGGRAAGFAALLAAVEAISRGRGRPVLVGGVDTCLDYPLLCHLKRSRRLKTANSADGLVPGEASAFVLCGDADSNPIDMRVISAALGREPGHIGSDVAYLGEGLSRCVSSVLERRSVGLVRNILAGFTGEHYCAREWTTALIRNRSRFTEDLRIEHPAALIGDVRAATVPLLLALASIAYEKKRWDGLSLVIASSDGETRGAAVLGPGAGLCAPIPGREAFES